MIRFSREHIKFLDIVNNSVNKNDKMILLYSEYGLKDNIKAMYDYFTTCGKYKDYKIVCSLNDFYKYYGKKHPKNVRFVGNNIGFYYYLQAKYCFYSYSFYHVKPANEQYVVNLSHGMPFKTQGNQVKEFKNQDFDFFTHTVVTADCFKECISEVYKDCNSRRFIMCGLPRTDEMFYNQNTYTLNEYRRDEKDKQAIAQLLDDMRYRYLFLWLPTYREYDNEARLPLITSEGLQKLNEELQDSAAVLLILVHPKDDIEIKFYEEYSNIFIRYEEDIKKCDISISGIMKYTQALITDYTSYAYDYLLLGKPLAYVVDDFKLYKHRRGFAFENAYEMMPGKKIKRQDDFWEFIFNCMSGSDTYEYERNELSKQVNQYVDGKSCETICKKIKLEEDLDSEIPSDINYLF